MEDILLLLVAFFGVCFLIWIKLSLMKAEFNHVYSCSKCGKESTLSNMKHYDYEYNYEYRCSSCGNIIVEG